MLTITTELSLTANAHINGLSKACQNSEGRARQAVRVPVELPCYMALTSTLHSLYLIDSLRNQSTMLPPNMQLGSDQPK